MKILHVGKYYPPFHGGMEVYLRDLCECQAINNHVTAIVHNHDYGLFSSKTVIENINNVDVIRQKSLKPILFTPIMFGLGQSVNNLITQHKVDVIHISWPNPSALLLFLNKKAKKKPWIIQWQSDMVTQNSSRLLKWAYRLFKPLERALLKKAKNVIISTREYAEHSNILPQFMDKCIVIPLGIKRPNTHIDDQRQNWATQQWGSAQYKIYSIGRLTFYKNHQLLIEAAQLLPEARFIITGTGELLESLTKLIKQNQLSNVQLTKSLDDQQLNALLANCDAFCLPSNDRAESYGMVLLEALNHGKTILVSDLPGSGMKWIASQTKLGHTFDCNDPRDLVKLIKSIDTTQIARQGNFPEKLTIKGCMEAINQLYQKTSS